MRDIGKIIKLDFVSIRPYYTFKNLIILIVLSVFYALVSKNAFVTYGVASMFTILFSSYPFLVGEESGIDILYAAFGIRPEKVVLGRYIWSSIVILIGILAGSILAGITTIILKEDFHIIEHLLYIIGIFFFSSIIILIQYPLYFKYRYKKAKTVLAIVFLIVTILIFVLGYFKDSFEQVAEFFTNNPYLILCIIVLIWICICILSIKLSINIYKKRDIV